MKQGLKFRLSWKLVAVALAWIALTWLGYSLMLPNKLSEDTGKLIEKLTQERRLTPERPELVSIFPDFFWSSAGGGTPGDEVERIIGEWEYNGQLEEVVKSLDKFVQTLPEGDLTDPELRLFCPESMVNLRAVRTFSRLVVRWCVESEKLSLAVKLRVLSSLYRWMQALGSSYKMRGSGFLIKYMVSLGQRREILDQVRALQALHQ
jgi:hypothetical protein